MFEDISPAMREVAENTAPEEAFGKPVAAADEDSDELTYTLGGTDAASFGIDPATGSSRLGRRSITRRSRATR